MNRIVFIIALLFFFGGCTLSRNRKDIERSKHVVAQAMECYKTENKNCANRYWDLQGYGVEHRGISRIKDYRLTKVKFNNSEIEVEVYVTHSGGITGEYSSKYLLKMRKVDTDWKIFSLLPNGY